MRNDYSTQSLPSAYWFLMGVTAGSALAMILTPYSGRDVRRRLSGEISHRAEQAEELFETGKRKVKEQVSRVDSAVQAGKDAYRRAQRGEDRGQEMPS